LRERSPRRLTWEVGVLVSRRGTLWCGWWRCIGRRMGACALRRRSRHFLCVGWGKATFQGFEGSGQVLTRLLNWSRLATAEGLCVLPICTAHCWQASMLRKAHVQVSRRRGQYDFREERYVWAWTPAHLRQSVCMLGAQLARTALHAGITGCKCGKRDCVQPVCMPPSHAQGEARAGVRAAGGAGEAREV
jgi:hypothetical protein